MLRFKHILGIIGILSILIIISTNNAAAQYYFYADGQCPLIECDSLISVKLNEEYGSQHFSMFEYEIEAFDEAHPAQPIYIGFDIFRVEAGHDIDSLRGELEQRDDIIYAYPAFEDSLGEIYLLNDHFVVRYADGVDQSTIDSIEAEYNVELTKPQCTYTGMRVLKITESSPGTCLDVANAFYESGLVAYSHPDFPCVRMHGYVPNDPLFVHQYYLNNPDSIEGKPRIDIGACKAWEISKGGVGICIIDDGFVDSHEDLPEDPYDIGYDYVGFSGKTPTPDEDPTPGFRENHGVACQGIIFAKHDNDTGICGVAPESYLIALKCWDNQGYLASGSVGISVFATAITDAGYYGAKVISGSWGTSRNFGCIDTAIYNITFGWPKAICVFSSGNYGEYYPHGESVEYPAKYRHTIAVGAIRRDGASWLYSGSGPELDVVAPSGYCNAYNGDVYTLDQMGIAGWSQYLAGDSTGDNYIGYFGGTSAACPQVAGILALVRSKRPDITSFDTLKMIIDSSAVDGIGDYYDEPGFDVTYGYGLANALRALLAVSRGDANNDGNIDMLDVTRIIDYCYKGGDAPTPDILMGDASGNALVNILDVTFIINYLYEGGPPPPISFEYGD